MSDEKIIKDAQYRKGLSIAFFNATNAAIALVSSHHFDKQSDSKSLVLRVCEIRDYFLNEHKEYYSTVIANVGSNFNASETIARMNNTKNMKELKSLWLSLSEDERNDESILKVKELLKKKYEKI